jgi:hypothetical protein
MSCGPAKGAAFSSVFSVDDPVVEQCRFEEVFDHEFGTQKRWKRVAERP